MKSNSFKQGYYCAVANLVRLHGAQSIAEDVLRNYGPFGLKHIDKLDAEVLRPIVKEIKRKNRLSKAHFRSNQNLPKTKSIEVVESPASKPYAAVLAAKGHAAAR